MRNILIPFSTILLTLLVLSGCSAYKIDVRQGNTLEKDALDSLRVGMTQKQVVFLLGNPLVRDPFHPQRWDYVYTFQPGGKKMKKSHLTLYFEGDKLVKIDKSGVVPALLSTKNVTDMTTPGPGPGPDTDAD